MPRVTPFSSEAIVWFDFSFESSTTMPSSRNATSSRVPVEAMWSGMSPLSFASATVILRVLADSTNPNTSSGTEYVWLRKIVRPTACFAIPRMHSSVIVSPWRSTIEELAMHLIRVLPSPDVADFSISIPFVKILKSASRVSRTVPRRVPVWRTTGSARSARFGCACLPMSLYLRSGREAGDVVMEGVGRGVPLERRRDVFPSGTTLLAAPAAGAVGVLDGLTEGPDIREHLVVPEWHGDGSFRIDQLATGSDYLGDRGGVLGDDWDAAGECLGDGEPEALPSRVREEDVERVVDGVEVLLAVAVDWIHLSRPAESLFGFGVA